MFYYWRMFITLKNECQKQKELSFFMIKYSTIWHHIKQKRVKTMISFFCYLTGVFRHSLGVNSCSGNPTMTKQCSLPAKTHRQNAISIDHLTSTTSIVRITVWADWKHSITSSQQTKCTIHKESNPTACIMVNILIN